MGIGALDTALTGVRIAQQQLSIIANNIANVSTPDYTRKILPQSAMAVNGKFVGVSPDLVTRNVNINLQRDFWTQVSSTSYYDKQVEYLSQIQRFNGQPDSGVSFSAILADMRDTFSQLSDDPSNEFLQGVVVRKAQDFAEKVNDFASFITKTRNDAQDEMASKINNANDLLQQISKINGEIRGSANVNRSTAHMEDQRDAAIKKLSVLMEISTFTRGDGVMVIQTKEGVQIADEYATTLEFEPTPLGPSAYYPDSAAGIYIGALPSPSNPSPIEITTDGIGGEIQALLDLRDDVFPEYIAQMDELAHKTALRFEAQGLRLFTNEAGSVPTNTDPIATTTTPVNYVGFASEIVVNIDIINDNSLLQKGTLTGIDVPVQDGSNEVIRRILDFTYGSKEFMEAQGSVAMPAIPATLQTTFSLMSKNSINTVHNLSLYTTDLNAASGQPFGTAPPLSDEFNLRLFDTRLGRDTGLFTIDLTNAAATYPIGAAGINNAADQLAAEINDQITAAIAALPAPAGLTANAYVNSYGQVKIDTNADIEIEQGTMGTQGLDFVGFTAGTYNTKDPYFDVQIGKDNTVRIEIAPDDDINDLLAKLNMVGPADAGVPHLYAALDGSNFLYLRPGNDLGEGFGGEMKVIGGTVETTGGMPILQSLFGTINPVTSIANTAFRYEDLGPGVNIKTNIISGTDLIDLSQKIINRQTDDILSREAILDDEEAFRATLENRFLNESGVNIEEELSHMIVVQSAFAAAARAIAAIDEMFDELISSFR